MVGDHRYVVKLDGVNIAGSPIATNTTSPELEAWIDPGSSAARHRATTMTISDLTTFCILCIGKSIASGVMYWSAPKQQWRAFYESLGGKFVYGNYNVAKYGILPAKARDNINVTVNLGGQQFVIHYDSLM